jgi:hypothetical protein
MLNIVSSDPTLFGRERWTATELGEALCLSTQRINQLVKEGVLPREIEGRYLPHTAVPAYIKYLHRHDESRSQAGESMIKIQLENKIRMIKLQRLAAELVPVEQVQRDWFEMARRVRDGLLNLPIRLSGVFAAETSQGKIFESFTKEVHDVLTELSTGGESPQESPSTPRAPIDI